MKYIKYIKWKTLVFTCVICLLPILLGVALWERLPDAIAVHFNFYSEPDRFASKGFAVFGLPLLMILLQIVCCVIQDVNTRKSAREQKLETFAKWIIPVMCIVLQCAILGYSVGCNIDMRKVATAIVSFIFLVSGYCVAKRDHIKMNNIPAEQAGKINRFIGVGMMIMGILGFVTVFLPPFFGVVWLIVLILYVVAMVAYGLHINPKRES